MEKLAICEYYDEWLHITQFDNEVKIIPEIKGILLSTTDFILIAVLASGDKTLEDRVKYPNSIIKDNELFKFIRKLYNAVLIDDDKIKNLKHINFPLRFKHIRFYRITNNEFIVTDSYENPIDYKNLLENAIADNKY